MRYSTKITLFLMMLGTAFAGLRAQTHNDTTVVQLIEFNDGLDNRRSWRVFPPDTSTYRKVLMYHTLKCDPQLISNPTGSGCGEWDAGANFTLYQHFNKDSLRYRVGLEYPDTIRLSSDTSYTLSQQQQYFIVYDSTLNESFFTMGSGTNTLSHTLRASLRSGRAQYLYKASDLSSAGLSAGSIDKLRLDISALGSDLKDLSIRMKHSALDSLTPDQYEMMGLQSVYLQNTSITATGLYEFQLSTPFIWDGVSNVVVEFLFTNTATGSDFSVQGHSTAYSSAVFATQDDRYVEFADGIDYIDVDTTIATMLDSAITISFWAYGDTANLPVNANMVNASAPVDGDRHKVLIRIPWGNEKIGWYAGYNSGTDNINIVADSAAMYEGKWNHWAFTKNAATGVMNIYFNGELWQTATGKTKLMDAINKFRIGNSCRDGENMPWYGKLNEFRLFNKELDSLTIVDWRYKDLNASHPNFSDLTCYYKFDGNTGVLSPDETGQFHGTMFGIPQTLFVRAEEQFRNLGSAAERPNIVFVQGSYNSHLDSLTVTDSIADESMSVVVSRSDLIFNQIGLQDVEIDTLYGWEDASGDRYINHYDIGDIRLMKYITPYGNYLDLGDGFTWIYDVTDYQHLLHDTLDMQGGDHRELIDWKFLFISGTPPRDIHRVWKLFDDLSGNYELLQTEPMRETVTPLVTASEFGMRYMVTGHSWNNPTNCAEFCARTHYFEVDTFRIHDWSHMTECALNPLFPQGGTWIYDRTGWCPGAGAEQFYLDLTPYVVPGTPSEILYSVMPDPTGNYYGNWNDEVHFIEYGLPNHNLDAEIYDIVRPNDWEFYGRVNPTCMNPRVILRNLGSTTLTSVEIHFRVLGGNTETYNWSGSLDFMDSTVVELPISGQQFWNTSSSSNIFQVWTDAPNGGTDDYVFNDMQQTTFEPPVEYTEAVIIRFLTNNAGHENEYRVKDDQGNIVFQKFWLGNNDLYIDTLWLPDGCYVFEVDDTDDDGLYFFNNNDGQGYVRLLGINNGFVEAFPADFGRSLRHGFRVSGVLGMEDRINDLVTIYPNPTRDLVNIDVRSHAFPVTIDVFDPMGERLMHKEFEASGSRVKESLDLRQFASGIYMVKVQYQDQQFVRKLVKQ